MKKYIFLTISALFILVFNTELHAQNRCKRYHTLKCKYHTSDNFQYSGMSRSAEFVKGTTSQFKINVFGGCDYRFAICYNKELGDVQFKILEDNKDKTLIFDNASENFRKEIILTTNGAKSLIIEVSIPNDGTDVQPESQRFCLGVLIEYMKTPQTGF